MICRLHQRIHGNSARHRSSQVKLCPWTMGPSFHCPSFVCGRGEERRAGLVGLPMSFQVEWLNLLEPAVLRLELPWLELLELLESDCELIRSCHWRLLLLTMSFQVEWLKRCELKRCEPVSLGLELLELALLELKFLELEMLELLKSVFELISICYWRLLLLLLFPMAYSQKTDSPSTPSSMIPGVSR